MKKILTFLFLIIIVVLINNCGRDIEDIEIKDCKWLLIWEDDFEENNINLLNWDYDIGNGFWNNGDWISGWGNNELQYYTDRPENSYTQNGNLYIVAIKEEVTGDAGGESQTFNYTSAKLKTQNLFGKKYGRFEFRAKVPSGKGYWPAIWMMPVNNTYGGWAASGEIDIMEARGSRPYEVSGALHYGGSWPNNIYRTKLYDFPENQDFTVFHIYSFEWEPGEMRWYVDNKLYQTQNFWYSMDSDGNILDYPAPFDHEFYIIFNFAVGGHFDGNPDETTQFPAEFVIDYVKVYENIYGYPKAGDRPDGELPVIM